MEEIKNIIPAFIYNKLNQDVLESPITILTMSKNELRNCTNLSENDVNLLINVLSKHLLKNTITKASLLIDRIEFLKTGCSKIDDAIKGICTCRITEIYGESSSGKTQLCLQLALKVQQSCQRGGLNGGCVYICTEDRFPSKRLHEMKKYFPKIRRNYEDNIFIEHIEDVDQLKHCLGIRLQILLSKHKIRLLVIDSIAGAFRYDNDTKNYITRSDDLKYIAEKLQDIAEEYKMAIVCINQVTSDPNEGIKPCLGLFWSNLIQNRFEMSRSGKTVIIDGNIISERKFKVIFSPYLPVSCINFVITKTGVSNCN